MVLYHGSQNKFEKFSYDFCCKNAGADEGYGFYFTDSKELAERYANGGYIYTVNIPIVKSLSENKNVLTKSAIKKLLLSIHRKNDILNDFNDIEYYGIEKVLNEATGMLLDGNDNDVDIISEICNVCGDKETVLKSVKETLGINIIISNDNKYTKNGEDLTIYIALDNDDIEINKVEKI